MPQGVYGRGSWTDERVALLKALVVSGASASQMARALNQQTAGPLLSRNAVIGKIIRLGLCIQSPQAAVRKGLMKHSLPTGCKKQEAKVRRTGGEIHPARASPRPPKPLPSISDRAAPDDAIPFITRTDRQCAYIYGEPRADAPCCGKPIALNQEGVPRSSWCEAHEARVFQPGSKLEPLDLRLLKKLRAA